MEETVKKIENNSCWYAVYTAVRTEMKVKEQLDKAGFENYVPLQPVVRIWNGRKKRIMAPVVPGCIFVYLLLERDRLQVAAMEGVSFLLTNERRFVAISDCQMATFRSMMEVSEGFVEFALVDSPVDLLDEGNHKRALCLDGLGCVLTMADVAYIKRSII